jgi:hypothetical protein
LLERDWLLHAAGLVVESWTPESDLSALHVGGTIGRAESLVQGGCYFLLEAGALLQTDIPRPRARQGAFKVTYQGRSSLPIRVLGALLPSPQLS